MVRVKSEALLVTLEQMVTALLAAVENPARGIKIATVPEIRAAMA